MYLPAVMVCAKRAGLEGGKLKATRDIEVVDIYLLLSRNRYMVTAAMPAKLSYSAPEAFGAERHCFCDPPSTYFVLPTAPVSSRLFC